mmetsp:Transcript_19307/g.37280  ORF Transcript_19307/g.37280 Transcript_19307/m.37280 type:complete len:246 (+) Transcript_19307:252-989(+)
MLRTTQGSLVSLARDLPLRTMFSCALSSMVFTRNLPLWMAAPFVITAAALVCLHSHVPVSSPRLIASVAAPGAFSAVHCPVRDAMSPMSSATPGMDSTPDLPTCATHFPPRSLISTTSLASVGMDSAAVLPASTAHLPPRLERSTTSSAKPGAASTALIDFSAIHTPPLLDKSATSSATPGAAAATDLDASATHSPASYATSFMPSRRVSHQDMDRGLSSHCKNQKQACQHKTSLKGTRSIIGRI